MIVALHHMLFHTDSHLIASAVTGCQWIVGDVKLIWVACIPCSVLDHHQLGLLAPCAGAATWLARHSNDIMASFLVPMPGNYGCKASKPAAGVPECSIRSSWLNATSFANSSKGWGMCSICLKSMRRCGLDVNASGAGETGGKPWLIDGIVAIIHSRWRH